MSRSVFLISGNTHYFSNGPIDRVTVEPDELTVGVPFVFSMRSEWFVAVKQADGRLTFYYLPADRDSWWKRFWKGKP